MIWKNLHAVYFVFVCKEFLVSFMFLASSMNSMIWAEYIFEWFVYATVWMILHSLELPYDYILRFTLSILHILLKI